MAFSLAIEVRRLQSCFWRSRFPGMDDPAFYVEVEREDPLVLLRTKSVRGNDAQWNEELMLPAVEGDQILQFRLKVVMSMIRDRVVGEAEWKVIRPVGYQEPYNDSIILSLSGRGNKWETCIGKITIIVREADPLSTTQHWNTPAKTVVDESDIKNQLQQHTLRGKVWKMLGHLDSLAGVIGAIDQAAKLNSYLHLAWNICSSLYKAVDKQCEEDQKISDLVDQINEILEFAQHFQEFKSDDVYLEKFVIELLDRTTECGVFIAQCFRSPSAKRLVGSVIKDSQTQINELQNSLKHILERLDLHMQILDLIASSNILEDMSRLVQSDILKCLKPAEMDAALKPVCLSGTRRDILRTISDWILNVETQEPNVVWLHGPAGSGKSTIAATISGQFGMIPSHRPGAFLFFERGKIVRGSVIQTIAAQLANSNPILWIEISESIRKYGQDIVLRDIDVQFEHLLRVPLEKASKSLSRPTLIVIDGLDEYGDEYTRRQLVKLISTNFTQLGSRFRIFVTSQSEMDIAARLGYSRKVKSVSLDAGQDTIPAIRLYLASEMENIHQIKKIASPWPARTDLGRLSVMSEGLFPWASALSQVIHTSLDPVGRLKQILSLEGTTCHRGIHTLYEDVLSRQLHWEDEQEIQEYREVMGIILFCRIPLSVSSMDQVLKRPAHNTCSSLFDRLRPLFRLYPNGPIIPFHTSLSDYLTDKTRSMGKPWSLVGFNAASSIKKYSSRLILQEVRCEEETSNTPFRRRHDEERDLFSSTLINIQSKPPHPPLSPIHRPSLCLNLVPIAVPPQQTQVKPKFQSIAPWLPPGYTKTLLQSRPSLPFALLPSIAHEIANYREQRQSRGRAYWFDDKEELIRNTLAACCLVSPRWNSVVTPILYENIVLKGSKTTITDLFLRTLRYTQTRHEALIKTINMEAVEHERFAILVSFCFSMPNLLTLILDPRAFDPARSHPDFVRYLRSLSRHCTVQMGRGYEDKIEIEWESLSTWLRFMQRSQTAPCSFDLGLIPNSMMCIETYFKIGHNESSVKGDVSPSNVTHLQRHLLQTGKHLRGLRLTLSTSFSLPDINLGSNPYLNLLQFRVRETVQESRNRENSTLFRWINSVCGSIASRSIVIILEDWPEASENCRMVENTLLGLRDKIPSLTVYFCGNEASHGYPMNTDVLFPRLWGAGIAVENSFGFDETARKNFAFRQ